MEKKSIAIGFLLGLIVIIPVFAYYEYYPKSQEGHCISVVAEIIDANGNVVAKVPLKSLLKPLSIALEGQEIPAGGSIVFYPILSIKYAGEGVYFIGGTSKTTLDGTIIEEYTKDLFIVSSPIPTDGTPFDVSQFFSGFAHKIGDYDLEEHMQVGETKTLTYTVTMTVELHIGAEVKYSRTLTASGYGTVTCTAIGFEVDLKVGSEVVP